MSKLLYSFTTRVVAFTNRHPICRGMASYGVIWPTSCLIQQSLDGKRWETYDWAQCARFALYASCFTAPTLYLWVRISTKIWPTTTFKTALTKAVIEQVSYGPAALISFFFGMSLLEGKSLNEAKGEVEKKFLPTYKVGICFWPVLQTINFYFIREKNRVMFVSLCSLIWASFLAYMKQLEAAKLAQQNSII